MHPNYLHHRIRPTASSSTFSSLTLFELGESRTSAVIQVLIRFSQHRVIVNDDLENDGKNPAPLNLPFGKLFFGFNIPSYVPPSPPEDGPEPKVPSLHLSLSHSSHTSSAPLPSLGRATPSMGNLPALLPRAQAKGRTRPPKIQKPRRPTRQGGEQDKDKAYALASQTGLVHGRSVPIWLV
jgi:hypothetical protein